MLTDCAAYHGHVAALVVHAVFLLEAAVVFFVDDDESNDPCRAGNSCRARTHHDAGFSGGNGPPRACAARAR